MRKRIIACMLCALPLFGADLAQESAKIDHLIEMTSKSLVEEKQVQELLNNYRAAHVQFYKDQDNTESLIALVKAGFALHESIQHAHLDHIFDPEFLSELAIIAKVGSKRGIPKLAR